MLSLSSSAALSFSPASAVRSPVQQRTTAPIMETKADLEALAKELNPIVGFWVRTPAATPASILRRRASS